MISESIRKIIPLIQEYMSTKPILRAWLFGSCARGEEIIENDIPLLIPILTLYLNELGSKEQTHSS